MIKREPKRTRNPVPAVDAVVALVENREHLSEVQDENSLAVGVSSSLGVFIFGTAIGLAGLSGFMGWPLYIIPILAVVMVTGIEIANPSLVADAQHARMNILLYLSTQVGLHCITGGIFYAVGFGFNYFAS